MDSKVNSKVNSTIDPTEDSAANSTSNSTVDPTTNSTTDLKMDIQQLDHEDNVIINLVRDVQIAFTVFSLDKRYQDLTFIGSGSSGVVCSAFDTIKKRNVAIKKLSTPFESLQEAKYTYRELKLMKNLDHKYIVKLYDTFTAARNLRTSKDSEPPFNSIRKWFGFKRNNNKAPSNVDLTNFEDLYLVMELLPYNLSYTSRFKLNHDQMSYIIYQLFAAVKYLADNKILHRDLRPPNVGINDDCTIKILDFGFARKEAKKMMMTPVHSRFYTAPELLFSQKCSTNVSDVWSIGCIISEMVNNEILFESLSELGYYNKIVNLLGSPSQSFIDKIPERMRNFVRNQPYKERTTNFDDILPDSAFLNDGDDSQTSPDNVQLINDMRDLLSKVLVIDPSERITAEEALKHPYISRWVDEDEDLVKCKNLKLDEHIDKNYESIDDWKKLVYKELIDHIFS